MTLNVTGANPQQLLAATDANGIATFQYTGQVAGFVDNLRASATYGASELRSGVARVTWNSGVNQAPLVSGGPPSTITMPAAAVLAGTVNDDGLPAGSTLNIQWTQVSGQGTATFDNPRSPQTHVTFSQPGSYVLRLTASDGVLSSNAEVTVGVNAEPTTLGRWIATPVHLSTITGTVDITTVAGLTLTSGTLSYYPGNFPNGAVTINSNVTGSGVIGTLDTSKLVNGTYWIRLQATNSAGQTQTSAVMVFVTGEYKPGRMKVTMTDLVVPAAGFPIRIER
ncbi:MAG: PKD domain-containing protein, partial [Bryobacterales bacterium]|nr:PKD domain-containing protein [Bryobacterales bacterium]